MTDTMTPGSSVAQWWAEQLGAQPFASTGDVEIDMMSVLVRPRGGSLTDEQVAKFVAYLTSWVDELVVKFPEYGVTLSTDYGPEGALVDAAEAAGISMSRFPTKTISWAYPDYVVVALGYGAQSRLHWSREGWERGTCNARHYVADETSRLGSRKLPEKCGLPRFHEEREHGSWIQMTEEEASAR